MQGLGFWGLGLKGLGFKGHGKVWGFTGFGFKGNRQGFNNGVRVSGK